MKHPIIRASLIGASLAILAGCGKEDPHGHASSGVRAMGAVEELTEDAANRLIEFSSAVRKRDRAAARAFLTPDFEGLGFQLGEAGREQELHAGTTLHTWTVSSRQAHLDREAWLGGLEELLAPLESIAHVFFKTRGAEFASDSEHGTVRLTVHVIGERAGGVPWSLYAWADGRVRRLDGLWCLARFDLERFQITERQTTLFTDVASSAGLARKLPRLGRDGNTNFYWRGAATGDVDGDGDHDIFCSTHDANHLYLNRGDGTFEDVADRMGLAAPVGATSPLFMDFDNDGDQDLFCAFVGWEKDGAPGGHALHLFRNDGDAGFKDVSDEVGLWQMHLPAFGVAAADFNGDGWLDLYVCGYNRLEEVYPDSWLRATNGSKNLLLQNEGGKRFKNVARSAGVEGRDWSYAAAVADYDADGDQDIYVANDYGDNNLFRNRGDGTFEDVAGRLGVLDTGNGMGAAWADLDNDGDLDLYVSNMSSSAGNRILKRMARQDGTDLEATLFKLAAGNTIFHQRDGRFERAPASVGGIAASWAWAPALLDIDLDGLLDIYVANGFISGDSLKDT